MFYTILIFIFILQKLLIEQQLLDGDDRKSRSGDSPNLTPSSNVSRRESSASSMDSKDSGSDAGGDEELQQILPKVAPSLLPPDPDRSPRIYGRGIRKPSFIAPIEEEQSSKLEEEEEEEEAENKETSSETLNKGESVAVNTTLPFASSKAAEENSEVTTDSKKVESEPPAEEQKRKLSEPQEFSRFKHVDAGDLVSVEGGDKVVSVLEFQTAQLKKAKKKYQSLSAEDIPTWVAQEKPQPVISARGDVTFEYKSRLPSIKAFIRKEANELASFLKGQQQQEPEPAEPAFSVSKGRNYPLFSIRPPTLDLSDHQLFQRHSPPEETIEIKVESKSYRALSFDVI